MNILVIGSGGREHALAWAIAGSPLADRVYCAPGNAGIAEDAECVPSPRPTSRVSSISAAADRIDFVVVGPEAPLVAGLVDALEAAGIAAFGPSAAAAALEGSKAFMKDLCAREGIPTAAYRRFRDAEAAKAYIAAHGAPVVVKADGLAAGKGVVVAATSPRRTRRSMPRSARDGSARPAPRSSSRIFWRARKRAFSRWSTARPRCRSPPRRTTSAPSTATPAPTPAAWAPSRPRRASRRRIEGAVMERIVLPTVRAMARDGRPFKGVLYAGLMLTEPGRSCSNTMSASAIRNARRC